jgi:FKBP-type peptidyl-prolyl cis-trans isomerase FklB
MIWKCMVIFSLGLLAVPAKAEEPSPLKSERDRMSYAVGVAQGRALRQQGAKQFNIEMVLKGLRDEFSGQGLLMSEDDYRQTYQAYQREMPRMMGKARQLASMENKAAGEAFLAENAKKEGVVILPSGLQYQVLVEGKGEKPGENDTVTCHYRGFLVDGTEIDSTYKRNQPATFELKRSISGWREALRLMSVGSKWKLFIPAELAYATQGAGEHIGPNATLIFEIELLSIQKH